MPTGMQRMARWHAGGFAAVPVKPRIGMVTHMGYEHDTVSEAIAGVRTHWDGLFALGGRSGAGRRARG
jgi:ribonuclease Z